MRHRASVPGHLFASASTLVSVAAIVAFSACGGTGTGSSDLTGDGTGAGAAAGTSSGTGAHAGKGGATSAGGTAGHAGTGTGGQPAGGGTAGSTNAAGNAGTGGVSAGGTSAAGGTSNGGTTTAGGSGGASAGAAGSINTGGAAGTGGMSTGGSPTTGQGGMSTGGNPTTGQGGSTSGCNPGGLGPNSDQDADGYTPAQGDCNDCDANVNPGAIDVLQLDMNGNPIPNQLDNNCDGILPSAQNQDCGAGLAIDSSDGFDAAKAMDICQKYDATKNTWGVIKADYETLDGTPLPGGDAALGHGILTGFGNNVHTKLGPNFFAISSGTARQPNDPGYMDVGGFSKGYTSGFLPGFPIESPACPGVQSGQPNDGILLRLQIKVPTNAKSFSFDFKFYTYEYPGFICSEFNDFFVVLMDPAPSDVNPTNENITFDSMKNPVSVNNAFLDVCAPGTHGGKSFTCAGNINELDGTGFEGHGATSWLKTTAAVVPGSIITLGFAAWDSGDGILDSTGIVDNFRWSATAAGGTVTEKP